MVDQTPADERVRLAVIHLEGRALQWHQNWSRFRFNAIDTPWEEYVAALGKRFGDRMLGDPMAELLALKQTCTVHSYHDQFESLLGRVDINEEYAISFFINGLKFDIQKAVKLFMPKSLTHAVALARLQETSNINRDASYTVPKTHVLPDNKPLLPTPAFKNAKMLSTEELNEKRAKGLCFWCNEKFDREHKCAKRQIYMLENQDGDESGESESDGSEEGEEENPLISVHAITGASSSSYRTMRVTGRYGKKSIHILIDSGNLAGTEQVEEVASAVNVNQHFALSGDELKGTDLLSSDPAPHWAAGIEVKVAEKLALTEVNGAEKLSGGVATHFSTIGNPPWVEEHLEKLADDLSMETVEGNKASVEVFTEVSKDTLLLGVRVEEAEMNLQESSSKWEVQTVGNLGKIHTASRRRSRSEERGKRNFEQLLVKQELISQVVCLAPPLCLVTEFMSSGRVFDDLQNRKSILKLPGTLKNTIDVTKGMSYLHQNTIIHRGLKVANLLMDENKVLKTVNAAVFGVAQVLVQLGIMTAEAEIWQGIASEVFRQKLYNHKDNVFIFEVMLWMLITGKSPYAHNWEQHPIIVEEPKHRTERVFRIFEELFQQFAAGNIRIPNLEVHVSQLKKHVGTRHQLHPLLPCSEDMSVLKAEKILDRRRVKRGNQAATQVLVQWTNSFPEDATWEFIRDLCENFQIFNLEGKVDFGVG